MTPRTYVSAYLPDGASPPGRRKGEARPERRDAPAQPPDLTPRLQEHGLCAKSILARVAGRKRTGSTAGHDRPWDLPIGTLHDRQGSFPSRGSCSHNPGSSDPVVGRPVRGRNDQSNQIESDQPVRERQPAHDQSGYRPGSRRPSGNVEQTCMRDLPRKELQSRPHQTSADAQSITA